MKNDIGRTREKVATVTGIFKSDFMGLSVGRLPLASQIDSAPFQAVLPRPSCMLMGMEAL